MSEAPTIRDKTFSRFYRPELDSWRFFAFLGVFVFHVLPHDPGFYREHHLLPSVLVGPICAVAGAGAFGVDLFFALSAYLITVLLLRERDLAGRIDDFTFIQNLGIAAGRVLVSASMGCHRSDRAQGAQMCHRVWMQAVEVLKRPNFLGLI